PEAGMSSYLQARVGGVRLFYREAGRADAPALLLLHGYPSSSRMFEPLLPLLADQFRLLAPDYPGFGLSDAPPPSAYAYSFEALAATVREFTEVLGLERYALYLQDYGGPVGMRLALARPERVRALVIQNAVAHEEGLTEVWKARRAWWADRSAHEAQIRAAMHSVVAGVARHVGGRPHPETYNPD